MLAAGTAATLDAVDGSRWSLHPAVWLLVIFSGLLVLLGGSAVVVGRALLRDHPFGRRAALLFAIPTLLMVPFGSVLSVYTFWVLLHADVGRELTRTDTISS
jgi:hypothetical protein